MKLIAETSWHHEGDRPFFGELVDTLVTRGRQDAIKFHLTLDFDAYMTRSRPLHDTLDGWRLDAAAYTDLLQHATRHGRQVMLLYNDVRAVEFGQCYQPPLVEIHALETINLKLVDAVAANLSPSQRVVIGVGGLTLAEVDAVVERLDTDRIVLMFGFQNYPTNYADLNFRKMRRVMAWYPRFAFGFADHCAWDEPQNLAVSLMGAAAGVEYLEKHVSTAPGEERCDYQSAISVDQLNTLRDQLDVLEQCQGSGDLGLSEPERRYSPAAGRKAVPLAGADIETGTVVTPALLEFRRSDAETDLSQLDVLRVMGQPVVDRVPKGTPLTREHFGLGHTDADTDPLDGAAAVSPAQARPRVGFVITARLKSNRLPRKILRDLAGQPLLDRVIDRCLATRGVDGVVLATSRHPEDAQLYRTARVRGIEFYPGHAGDVLQRIHDAAVYFGYDAFVSITADNPLFSIRGAEAMVDEFRRRPFDFGHLHGLPMGCAPYFLSVKPLSVACAMKATTHTEIWGPYVLRDEFFQVAEFVAVDSPFDESRRLTCDYPEDHALLDRLFRDPRFNDVPQLDDVLAYLANSEDLWNLNAHRKQTLLPETALAEIRREFDQRMLAGREFAKERQIPLRAGRRTLQVGT